MQLTSKFAKTLFVGFLPYIASHKKKTLCITLYCIVMNKQQKFTSVALNDLACLTMLLDDAL
jgi:hypothetical protein